MGPFWPGSRRQSHQNRILLKKLTIFEVTFIFFDHLDNITTCISQESTRGGTVSAHNLRKPNKGCEGVARVGGGDCRTWAPCRHPMRRLLARAGRGLRPMTLRCGRAATRGRPLEEATVTYEARAGGPCSSVPMRSALRRPVARVERAHSQHYNLTQH